MKYFGVLAGYNFINPAKTLLLMVTLFQLKIEIVGK
jgi:hypothetical protein